jgi:hypothetical protein
MKRISVLFILLFLITDIVVVNAQPRRYDYKKLQPKLGYGIKAGLNIAGQSSSADEVNIVVKNIPGINAGGYCNYFILDFLAVQAELMISGKGAHWRDYYDNMKDILTYIDVPLLIKYQPVKFVNFHAGIVAGLRIKATQKDLEAGTKNDIKDYYNFTDYGLAGGVEANLPNRINLTLRYIYGISAATTDVLYLDPWKNNVIQFSIGYRFSGR